jgi:SNF2 family DNA or RNA helicase
MGLGKTLTAIKIAEEKERPVLVIAPKALCNQWKDEIEANKEKDWNVVVCTSDTKKKKSFREAFEKLMETEE